MIEEYEGLKVCDKAILFAVLTCCIISVRHDCPIFLNFATGFSIGGSVWYWMILSIQYKKAKKMAEKAIEEAKKSQEELESKLKGRCGDVPGWYRE